MKKRLLIIFFIILLLCSCTKNSSTLSNKASLQTLLTIIDSKSLQITNSGGVFYVAAKSGETFEYSPESQPNKDITIAITFMLKPFIDAGLDVDKLDQSIYSANSDKGILTIKRSLGQKSINYKKNTNTGALEGILQTFPFIIENNNSLDLYSIDVGDGNRFAWPVNSEKKAIYFLLNAAPFEEAGLDTSVLEGHEIVEYKTSDSPAVYKIMKEIILK